MKEWTPPVSFEVCGTIKIKAESIEKAIEKFNKDIEHIPFPKSHEYVDGSFCLSSDDIEYIKAIQPKQKIYKQRFYSIDLIWYDENNIPKTETTIYVTSKTDLKTVPLWGLKSLEDIKEQLKLHNCETIGNIFEIPEKEFYEESGNEFIEL